MSEEVDTYPVPPHGWVCFHCGKRFSGDIPGTQAARDHFGDYVSAIPACQIWGKVNGWRSAYRKLIHAVRCAERERDTIMRALLEDDTQKDRQIAALISKHQAELQRAEEAGYAKGLRDGRAMPAELAPAEPDRSWDLQTR